MNIFIIHSGQDQQEVASHIAALKRENFDIRALILKNGNALWKVDAGSKIKRAHFVVFFIGENSHKSPYIAWEIKKAIQWGKPIYTIKLKPSNQRHPALTVCDPFSGEDCQYDTETTFDGFSELLKNHFTGQYNVFNGDIDKIDKSILLEQYKSFLQTSEDLVFRRQNVNNFYISINSILLTIFGGLFPLELLDRYKLLIGGLFSLIGIVLSVSWAKILDAYGNLNSSKMKIISSIEKCLPASLYDAEWAALSDKLNAKRYVSFTENEKKLPVIFIFIYICLFAVMVVMNIFN